MEGKNLQILYMHNTWICSFGRIWSGFQSEMCQKINIFCDKNSIKIKFDVVHDHHIVHILKWLCCCSS